MIGVIVAVGILVAVGVIYGLARSGRWTPRSQRHLPSELQIQELDRLAFQHRIRTRAILDSALHRIERTASEHRDGR